VIIKMIEKKTIVSKLDINISMDIELYWTLFQKLPYIFL
jgi:hypothetical protein